MPYDNVPDGFAFGTTLLSCGGTLGTGHATGLKLGGYDELELDFCLLMFSKG